MFPPETLQQLLPLLVPQKQGVTLIENLPAEVSGGIRGLCVSCKVGVHQQIPILLEQEGIIWPTSHIHYQVNNGPDLRLISKDACQVAKTHGNMDLSFEKSGLGCKLSSHPATQLHCLILSSVETSKQENCRYTILGVKTLGYSQSEGSLFLSPTV